MTFEIEGEYNSATVYTEQSREECEQEALDQIKEMVNHEAFEGDENVAIMPDFHWGAGAVIGFTMPLDNRIVPNTIGVDIGCGMYAVNFGEISKDEIDCERLDSEIRARIPMGFDVHDRNDFHMKNDFPWNVCRRKLDQFAESTDFDLPDGDKVYGPNYFDEICREIGYDDRRAINSVGTLGGGNHFIELGRDESGDVWCIIHSGSRGIGAEIAQYWQDRATDRMNDRAMASEIPESIDPYLGEDWKPKADKIREDFDGEEIQNKFDEISQFIQKTKNAESNRNTNLDYLEGDEARGYIIDMVFAQTYASVSRQQMMRRVNTALLECGHDVRRSQYTAGIESVHNYIDFEDATIRKGACRAHDGEQLVVPFNMKYGTIIARGKGKDSWNNSSAHGAGRAMSRTEAKNRFDDDDFDEQTEGVFMSKQPTDEIPGAYKSPEDVERALGGNVEVENRIEPFLSIKAE
jgi:tRNA-splicing ligase RtcB